MPQWIRKAPLESAPTAQAFAVRLDERAGQPLSLSAEGGRAVATLRPVGLKRAVVAEWLRRCHVPVLLDSPPAGATLEPFTLLPVSTIVVCADERISDIAALYARSVDAPVRIVRSPEEATAAIDASTASSATFFVLNDRLTEPLCHAAAAASGRRPGFTYGFMSAFTPEHLGWLIVKSWALFLRPFPDTVGFADWTFSGPAATARVRFTDSGRTSEARADEPWRSSAVTMLSIRGHGAPFDLSLGDVVLCGQLDPPLPAHRRLRAPSCVHNDTCFRMKSAENAPSVRFKAVDAAPLVWCLDSCASVPFADSAFGEGTSYVFGLIAGAAVGVIGPFLDLSTHGSMSRDCEAVLATGGTLGEVAATACRLEPAGGFDKFLLIGSPDLRLLPVRRLEGRRHEGAIVYEPRGQRQLSFRLGLPADVASPVSVVGDDGGAHWSGAHAHVLEHGTQRDLLVVLEHPVDLDGSLRVGLGEAREERLVQLIDEAAQVADNLGALRLYPFATSAGDSAARCRRLARLLREVASQPRRLRCHIDASVVLAHLMIALDDLHRRIAAGFVAAVATHDVNLDRFAADRFDLLPTARSVERCPTCGGIVYVTLTRWRRKPSYQRRWVQCPNCSGISMTLVHSPLSITAPVAARDGDALAVSLQIANRSDSPVHAIVAGQARQGVPAAAAGPLSLSLAPGHVEDVRFTVPLGSHDAGVLSYRVVVLCRAGVEFVALKHVLTPIDKAAVAAAADGLSAVSAHGA